MKMHWLKAVQSSNIKMQRHQDGCCRNMGFPKLGVPCYGAPHNKDCNILVYIVGSPYFGRLPSGQLNDTDEEHRANMLAHPQAPKNTTWRSPS